MIWYLARTYRENKRGSSHPVCARAHNVIIAFVTLCHLTRLSVSSELCQRERVSDSQFSCTSNDSSVNSLPWKYNWCARMSRRRLNIFYGQCSAYVNFVMQTDKTSLPQISCCTLATGKVSARGDHSIDLHSHSGWEMHHAEPTTVESCLFYCVGNVMKCLVKP